MTSLFSHLSTIYVFHTCLQFLIYIFNCTVIRLSWHILYYLISKNLYSLPNAQSFIFQLICIQLCKYLNCFLKTHNKQLNQYYLNFIIFFLPKKKSFKKWFRFGSGWLAKSTGQVMGQLVFVSGQKIGFESGQKILTRFFMSCEREKRNIFPK